MALYSFGEMYTSEQVDSKNRHSMHVTSASPQMGITEEIAKTWTKEGRVPGFFVSQRYFRPLYNMT